MPWSCFIFDAARAGLLMATITKEFLIAANQDAVWDALRDFHAVHERVAPGFLTAATHEGDDRILTFFNGMVARERLVGRDDAMRRIAYTIVEGRFDYHHASAQVFPTNEAVALSGSAISCPTPWPKAPAR
jgi:hypothetical protein